MRRDYSYGIIPLRRIELEWHVLLVQHQAGHWAFPKGHPDAGESPQQAAERELCEETGLEVLAYLSQQLLTERYYFTFQKERIYKVVEYFLALVDGEVAIQEAEIKACRWLALSQAAEVMTFQEGKNLCREAQRLLSALPSAQEMT